ncbi:hypothetical protein WA026_015072 [Henosepilachna vigintioctopunctata]|uniref:Uncharacterized protein n=1 Tax=Henosepilachna vigintioctopunctata TaxID=420089 RepID=A0AAW1TZ24_9CUCU
MLDDKNGRQASSKINQQTAKDIEEMCAVNNDHDNRYSNTVTKDLYKNMHNTEANFTMITVGSYKMWVHVEVKELVFESKRGNKKSLLVKEPFARKDEPYNPEFWSENVEIKRFNMQLYEEINRQANPPEDRMLQNSSAAPDDASGCHQDPVHSATLASSTSRRQPVSSRWSEVSRVADN